MKSVKFLIKSAVVLMIVWMASCKADEILNVCTTCTESGTGVSDTYCGNLASVQTYESTLQNSGSGTWNCVRN